MENPSSYKGKENNYTYDYFLRTFPNLLIKGLDDAVTDLVSTLRTKYKIRTPDAI